MAAGAEALSKVRFIENTGPCGRLQCGSAYKLLEYIAWPMPFGRAPQRVLSNRPYIHLQLQAQ